MSAATVRGRFGMADNHDPFAGVARAVAGGDDRPAGQIVDAKSKGRGGE